MQFVCLTKKNHWQVLSAMGLLVFGLLGGSCMDKTPPKLFAEFYAESPQGAGVPITMPVSQLQYGRQTEAFTTAAEVVDVQEGQMPDGAYCVVFKFNDAARREIYRQSVPNQGKHFFLVVNDKPVGVRFVDHPIEDGILYFYVEIPEPDKAHPNQALVQFVFDMQDSLKRIAEMKKK